MIKILELLFLIMESILKGMFELFEMIFSLISKKSKGYKADFAPVSSLLSSQYRGFCLTGSKNLTVKLSYQNAIIVGGTGVGKSSVILIPSIYTMQGSFVIHDPSGELFSKSAGYLQTKGYIVKTLNFAAPERSCGYNPLERASSSSDIQKISAMLIENALGSNGKDPFWTKMGEGLLSMLITILKKQEPQYQNLYNLRQLLNYLGSYPEKMDSLFARYSDPVLYSEYKSFNSYDDKVISGVTATCKAALQIFGDGAVARVTSLDTLDLQDFRNKKVALFIQNSVSDQKYYAVLTSIFFEQFFAYVMSRFPEEKEQDIFLLIDECSSLKLPTLPTATANIRKHRTGAMLIVQDFSQVVHHYGKYEAEAIRSNCFSKLFFTGTSLETSKELEQTLGKFEYEDKDKRKVVRPLMTNDEIRTMKTNRALLICGHHPPIKTKLYPYYENSAYLQHSKLPPAKVAGQIPPEAIPILPIDLLIRKKTEPKPQSAQ
jgi:type IV secretion system protein VirD4